MVKTNSSELSLLEKQRLIREQFEIPMQAIDELLTPTQSVRLRQLANRREIHVIGYVNAMTRGELAEVAGVMPDQVETLGVQASQILADLRDEVEVLRRNKEEVIL